MNNSLIRPEPTPDSFREKVAERETTLVNLLEAIREVSESRAWSTLKTEFFDGLNASLVRELHDEAKKGDPNTNKLNRIAGEMKWAERFATFEKWENELRLELQAVRTRLYGKEE